MKFINIIYFVLAVFILAFVYRGFAVTWNNRLRREEEQRRLDGGNDDPANA